MSFGKTNKSLLQKTHRVDKFDYLEYTELYFPKLLEIHIVRA